MTVARISRARYGVDSSLQGSVDRTRTTDFHRQTECPCAQEVLQPHNLETTFQSIPETMAPRHSGLQKEVLALYRRCVPLCDGRDKC